MPDELPQTPLQQDFNQQLKSVRLAKEAVEKTIELDLRTDAGRNRSVLLYRLQILGLSWGRNVGSRGKGTFKENWRIQWQPEFELTLIEKNLWGTTIAHAAEAFAIADLQKADSLTVILEACNACCWRICPTPSALH
nr:DUF5682 family protein [Methylocucumis oryzae]